jgi:predicted transcriptional regulator of viral defense system
MAGMINQHDFMEIYDAIKRMGVASVDQVANATKYPKTTLKHKLSFYTRTGRIFRVSKGHYSVDPAVRKDVTYKQKRQTLQQKRAETDFIAACFNNMVRAG